VPQDQCATALALKGTPVPGGMEYIAERPDGVRLWFTPYTAALRDGGGRIVVGITILVDITDRKRAEIEAAEHFHTIVETPPECVTLVAFDGTLLFMNAPGLAMVGAASAKAVLGKNVYDLIAPSDRERYREFNERVCRGEKGTLQFDIDGPQGERRRMETHAAPFRHTDGTTVHLAITRDITERRTEKAAYLLAAIVDSSDDAIISKDLNGVITSWNNSAERMFGYTAAEAVGRPVTMLIPPDRLEEEPEILLRLRRGERVDHFETVRRRKDGKLLDISLTISPVRDARGVIVGASKIARDISAQKRAERDLRRANEDLEQFALSASHDLQEPLRTVKIYGQLLTRHLGEGLDQEARELVRYMRDGAAQMEKLVQDLLAYTQAAKADEPIEAATDLNEVLRIALTNLAGAITESGAQITVDPLPALKVHPAHLQQLFQNLISNALKYRSPQRPLLVNVTAERRNGEWVFSIRDNGIGIEAVHQRSIFALFTRLHTREKYSGTGLG